LLGNFYHEPILVADLKRGLSLRELIHFKGSAGEYAVLKVTLPSQT
jgi:hypothetical protein